MLEKNGLAALRTSATGMNEVYLQLAPGQSCVLKTFGTVLSAPLFSYLTAIGDPQEINGAWSVEFVEGGPELPSPIEIRALGSWTDYGGAAVKNFSGAAIYTISFQQPEGAADGWLLDLGQVGESARVRLNEQHLGTLIAPPYRIIMPKDLMREENLLEIRVSNLMANRIADLDRRQVNWKKFYNINFPARLRENRDANGRFTASHWLPRDSGLMGPVRILPMEIMAFERE